MSVSQQRKNQHLLWRAGFGPMAEMGTTLGSMSTTELYGLLKKSAQNSPQNINTATPILIDGEPVINYRKLTKEQRQYLRRQAKVDIKNLNLAWFNKMEGSEAQLREKMSLFWHGHFACRIQNIYSQQQLLNTIRENALGNFGDLLRKVSKSSAMLAFLNNQQNRKQHPNENFAREVMELFTLGRGNYTEEDVKEGARAFTGWGFDNKFEFVFRKIFHDHDTKIFLGQKGNFNGDDIIDIILKQKQCALFITKKIYRFFVNEKINESRCKTLADNFYKNNYNIQSLLDDIFMSNWFYDEENIGNKIKSPLELLTGIRRLIPMSLQNPQLWLLLQQSLGQLLFYPPNVAGWPGGYNWIDSSSLMLRMKIPQVITNSTTIDITPKTDDDVMMGSEGVIMKKNTQRVLTDIKWNEVVKIFQDTKKESLLSEIRNLLWQTKSEISPEVLEKYIDRSSRENYIKSAVVALMSTPEYQLC